MITKYAEIAFFAVFGIKGLMACKAAGTCTGTGKMLKNVLAIVALVVAVGLLFGL